MSPFISKYRILSLLLLFIYACGDDDSGGGMIEGEAIIRIVKADPETNTYTFHNFGEVSEDISNYRLCSEFFYTPNLTGLTLVSGSFDLAPGNEVTVSGFATDEAADLGLFLPNGNFDEAEAMVDFLQWGSGGNGRESVAVSKGIWTAGDFIDGVAPYEYTGNGMQSGVGFWNATGMPPAEIPNIRILKVFPGSDTYEIRNFDVTTVDISDYLLCSEFLYSLELSTLTICEGSLNLTPDASVTLTGFAIDDNAADFGLYVPSTPDFADPANMVDFVQYGSSGNGREPVADEKGIWSAGDFLATSDYYEYAGDGTQNGLSFWEEKTFMAANIRLIMVDPANDTYIIKNFGEESLNISSYRLCSKFVYQSSLATLTINSGSLDLGAGEEVSLSGFAINDTAADLGLYIATGGFGSQDSMVDFVQWGSGGNGRESVANGKGIWTAGTFLSGSGPFNYTGDGTQNGVDFWE